LLYEAGPTHNFLTWQASHKFFDAKAPKNKTQIKSNKVKIKCFKLSVGFSTVVKPSTPHSQQGNMRKSSRNDTYPGIADIK